MNNQRRHQWLFGMILAVVVLMGTVDLARQWISSPKPPVEPGANDEPITLSESQQRLRDEATTLQLGEKWCEAVDAWKKLIDEIPADAVGALESLRKEAEQNLRRIEPSCRNKPVAVGQRVSIATPKEKPSRRISAEDLLEWYPQGKTVRSAAWLHIGGRGTNSAWGFKGESHFQYVYRIASETNVVKNDPTTRGLVFEQTFHEVSQTRAVSRQTLEFDPPENVLGGIVWNGAEGVIAKRYPIYIVVREGLAQWNKLDPKLKNTLTWFQDVLRLAGRKINTSDEIEFVTAIERISGTKVRIEYDVDLGVVAITRLDGLHLTEDELMQLAQASTLLMDYYIFPGLNQKVGEHWQVQAADISQMVMPLAADLAADGTLMLSYSKDDGDTATYKVVRGELLLRENDQLREQQGRFTIKSGTARFSKSQRIIRDARLMFDADVDSQLRPDSLLFGTKAMRDLQVESRYQAEIVESK